MAEKWFAIFRAGDYGKKGNWPVERLEKVIANYDPGNIGPAPIQVDHNNTGKPIHGLIAGLKLVGDTLWAKPANLAKGFVSMVKTKDFKGVSVQFNKAMDYLCHVAFLTKSESEVEGLPYPAFDKSDADCVNIVSLDAASFESAGFEEGGAGAGAGDAAQEVKRVTEDIVNQVNEAVASEIAALVKESIQGEIKKAMSDALYGNKLDAGGNIVSPPPINEIGDRVREAVKASVAAATKEALKAFAANFSKGMSDAGTAPVARDGGNDADAAEFSVEDAAAFFDASRTAFMACEFTRDDFLKSVREGTLRAAMREQVAEFARKRKGGRPGAPAVNFSRDASAGGTGNRSAKTNRKGMENMAAVNFSREEKERIMSAYYDVYAATFKKERVTKNDFLRFGVFMAEMADAVNFERAAGDGGAARGARDLAAAGSEDAEDFEAIADAHDQEQKRKRGYYLKNREMLERQGVTEEAFVEHGRIPETPPAPASFSKNDAESFYKAHPHFFRDVRFGVDMGLETFLKCADGFAGQIAEFSRTGKVQKWSEDSDNGLDAGAASFDEEAETVRKKEYFRKHRKVMERQGVTEAQFVKHGNVPARGASDARSR